MEGVIAFLGALFGFIRRTVRGKRSIEFIVLRVPVIKHIVKEMNSARTARTLSSLLATGVEVVQSLEITTEVVQNSYYREVLDEAKNEIKKGQSMSSVFARHEDLYPIFVSEMLSIGEETGHLGDMLANVADYYEAEVDQKTKDLSTIIEPVLMIVVGCAVGFFALAMLSPTYSLVDKIQ